ncbi:hypothetical protein AB0M43_11010 [Longispora sp. NPDC051575]|uniref:hypothetical protein n=1 Tax=Longispora sp. NPDC051575 TaxID=3154943 RepID=UPI003443CF22
MSLNRNRLTTWAALVAAGALTLLTPGVAHAAPPDLQTATTLNAAPLTVALAAEQNGRITFPGTAGQQVVVALSYGTYGPSGATARLLLPDGTQATSKTSCGANCTLAPQTLGVTGTYTVVVDPTGVAAGSIRVQTYETTLTVAGAVIGGPGVPVTTVAHGQQVQIPFTGTAGQRVSLRAAGGTSGFALYARTVLGPDGTAVYDVSYPCHEDCLVGPVVLPADGVYVFRTTPSALYPFTFTLYDVGPDGSVAATPGGPAVSVPFPVPGRNATVTFTGTAGQRVSALLTDQGTVPVKLTATLYSPSGAVLTPDPTGYQPCPPTCLLGAATLPEDGEYRYQLAPTQSSTGVLTVQLFLVPSTVVPLTVDGPSGTASPTVPGERPTFQFPAVAGERLFVKVDLRLSPWRTTVDIFGPTGAYLKGAEECGGRLCNLEEVLPTATGTHTIVVRSGLETSPVSAQVYSSPALPTVAGTLDGPPLTLTAVAAGQQARVTFKALWKQRVGVKLTGGTFSPTTTKVQVVDHNGTALITSSTCGTTCYLEAIPDYWASDTYTVIVDPDGTDTGSITLSLTDGREVVTPTALGDPAVPLAVALPAQRGVATFAGTAGQRVFLQLSGGTYGTASSATATLRKPDGGTLLTSNCGVSCVFETFTLPTTGTYSVAYDPKYDLTGTVNFRAWAVAADLAGTVATDGTATAVSTTTPGQNAELTFPGTAGQRIAVKLSGGTYGAADTTVVLRRPDGSTLVQNVSCGASCFLDTRVLPDTGTYSLLVDPEIAAVGGITAQVYDVPADVAVSTSPGGGPKPVAVTTVGQNAVVSFTATAGQVVTVAVTGATFGPSTGYVLRRPDGSTLTSKTSGGANTTFASVTLPVAGVYTLLIDPATAATGTATVTVT